MAELVLDAQLALDCTHCDWRGSVPSAWLGRRVRCRRCMNVLAIGAPAQIEPPSEAVAAEHESGVSADAEVSLWPLQLAGVLITIVTLVVALNSVIAVAAVGARAMPYAYVTLVFCCIKVLIGIGVCQRRKKAFYGLCGLALLATLWTALVVGLRATTLHGLHINGIRITWVTAGIELVWYAGCYVFPIVYTRRHWDRIRWAE